MPRAGGGGGGHVSSGGHSSGRVSGGHRVGGSRAGGGSFGGSSFRGGGFRGPRHRYYGGPGRRTVIYSGGGRGSSGGSVLVAIFVVIICVLILSVLTSGDENDIDSKSTIERTKLETGNAYINDCIIDEIGWFENISSTETKLKYFWEKTGVQPYVILHEYDAELTTDSEKQTWAEEYYEGHFDTENIFLYVYFAEKDTDNDVGYMVYVNGKQTSSVMDSQAVEIFWNYLDKYWYGNGTTDQVFIDTFEDTADTIMKVSTNPEDVKKWFLIAAIVVAVLGFIVYMVRLKIRRAKEKAEEDQKILNTPINDMAEDAAENLTKKYLNEDDKSN